MSRKQLTDAEIIAKKARVAERKEKRISKRKALLALIDFAKTNSDDTAITSAVKLLTPGQRGSGVRRPGLKDAIADLITNMITITEDEIWSEYKLGRAEMRKITVNFIKKREPEDRLWVTFDPEEGTYTLLATGAEIPENWTGYKPVQIEDMEII